MSNLTIRISFDEASAQRIQAAKEKPKQLLAAIVRGQTKGTAFIHGAITKERLTGQGPFPVDQHRLGVKSGLMRKSLRWTKAESNGNTVTSAIGTNVRYAGAHEFGFSGNVQVKAHTRVHYTEKTAKGTKSISGKSALRVSRKGGKRALNIDFKSGQVRAHTRKVNILERAPIRTGVREHRDVIATEIAREVAKLA